jgi:hypothetical protein
MVLSYRLEADMKIKSIAQNQTEVHFPREGIVVLFSYDTPVAASIGRYWYKTSKRWTGTISRHINEWLPTGHAIEKPQEFFDNLCDSMRIF